MLHILLKYLCDYSSAFLIFKCLITNVGAFLTKSKELLILCSWNLNILTTYNCFNWLKSLVNQLIKIFFIHSPLDLKFKSGNGFYTM